jgi:gluconokinase
MSTISLTEAASPLVLALDAGTSSVRAIAYDLQGRAVAESEEQIAYLLETSPDGGAFFGAKALFDITVRVVDGAVARLGSRASDVAAVGTTSFWHSLLGLDANGEPTSPVLYWADRRAAAEAIALRDALDPETIWQRTGCRLHPSYWPAKLRWLRVTAGETFRRSARWVSFAEYALGRLCSREAGAATVCMASGTGLLNVHNLVWDEEMLTAAGVEESQLSELVDLGPPGLLRAEFALRWPALSGALWFPALGDGACANVGSGALGSSRIALTIGTSAAMRMILERPPGTDWAIPRGLWAYRLNRRLAVLGGALSNGGNVLRWVLETTGSERDGETMAEALALAPDSTGLTFLPFLAGERSPGWHDDASGVIAGLTLAARPSHLIRAALEAVAYRLAAVHDLLTPLAASNHQILVSGGAILGSPAWLQLTADVLGRPLTALSPGDESTARGAALMAASSSKLIPDSASVPDAATHATLYIPDSACHAAYHVARQRQQRLERILAGAGGFV